MKNLVFEFTAPITVVTEASISEDADLEINILAIDETVSSNNIRYLANELEMAASSLSDKPILKDHNNSVDAMVGRTGQASFNPTKKAVMTNARIVDKHMKELIKKGIIKNVSVGAEVEELINEKDSDIQTAKGIRFRELSLVAVQGVQNAAINQSFPIALSESAKTQNDKIRGETMDTKDNPAPPSTVNEMADLTKEVAELRKQNETLVSRIKAEDAEKAKAVEKIAFDKLVAEQVDAKVKEELARAKVKETKNKAQVYEEVVEGNTKTPLIVERSRNGMSFFSPHASAKNWAEYTKLRGGE